MPCVRYDFAPASLAARFVEKLQVAYIAFSGTEIKGAEDTYI